VTDDWPTRFAEILDRYQRRQQVKRTIRAAMATARKAGLEARQQAKTKNAAKEKNVSDAINTDPVTYPTTATIPVGTVMRIPALPPAGHIRIRYATLGAHVHCSVWSTEGSAETTHDRNGKLVFRESEFELFRDSLLTGSLGQVEFLEDPAVAS